jgi:hypothetical protein
LGQKRFLLPVTILAACVSALVLSAPASTATSCASRLLADWQDGRIDGVYPVACYRQALAHLPEDVRVYSSAQSDITRALQARLGAPHARAAAAAHGSRSAGISPFAVLGVTGALLLLAGGSLAVARR